ncbi:MAG: response regulator, partial [Thiomicrorhabdus sp.]|nr:response regulator [Thiomicrorhabdus sp.]
KEAVNRASDLLEHTTLEAAATKNSVEHQNGVTHLINVSGECPLVLIADDSKINLMVLGGYLQELNCVVVEAKNGREAWQLFQENTFDYVFLDIQMPFLDGMEVSHKIKACVEAKCDAAKNLKKVFAVTAGGDESNFTLEGEPVGSNGFNHWFVKPVSKEQIVAALQEEGIFELPEESPHVNAELNTILDDLEKGSATLKSKKDIKSSGGEWEGIEDVPESFQALIHDFLLDLNAGIEELKSLVREDNVQKLLKKAHYLKGNCMLLQLNGMVSVLREIEEYAQKNKHLMGNKQKKTDLMLEKLMFGLKYLEKSIMIRHNA